MENRLKLIDTAAAGGWDNGMVLGNGRLGAIVPGSPYGTEIINLNEDSIWCAPFIDRSNRDAKKYVGKIRELLRAGKVKEADKLCYMAMSSSPKYFGAYEPMCQLWIFNDIENVESKFTDYKRELDIQNGIGYVEFKDLDLKINKEAFVSHEYQTFVYKFTADKPELNFHMHLMRRPFEYEPIKIENDTIIHMTGQGGKKGVKFDCMLSAKTDGEMTRIGDFIGFKDASEIIIYVTANTDFYEKNPAKKALKTLKAAMAEDYEVIKAKHIKDFSSLYNRVSLNFNGKEEDTLVPLNERLDKMRSGYSDNGLLELFFNYARYLMISASRPGTQAMNLQGIWNWAFAPPWDCNYTVNINTQMNYWIAETAQLSECHEPLFTLIERMVPRGEKVAKQVYGCDGLVIHHASNIWGDAAINGNSFPSSLWPVGGAWLVKHMWDHYLYTRDKEFLKKRAFPIMKKEALFYTQYMTEGADGYFETGPSLSPENCYISDEGKRSMHCMGPEMDHQIVRSLFRSLLSAYEILDCCDSEYEKYKEFAKKIRPTRINKKGGIMEWDKDYVEYDPGHRHISPLFALHPDYAITPDKTPQLAEACEQTIINRLSGSELEILGFVYWNGAWVSACYSKLKKGEKALSALYEVLRSPDRVSNALLIRAPIFQIESSFGIASALVEMVLYSDEERVELLPALSDELKDGSFNGLCARGGFVIDAAWKDGKVTAATIEARDNNVCRIKAEGLCGVNTEYEFDGEYLVFNTKKGGKYELSFN